MGLRRKILVYFSFGVICFTFSSILPMAVKVRNLGDYRRQLAEEVRQLERENRDLRRKIEGLRGDPYMLEWMMRRRFRMVRPDEVLVR
ncbi:MAG: hypothetical protein D6805_04130 [Planctomycetota bacterium]|nr:MAG: hypothetical protein D6805_04130 [Planctomycetota bacterium]